MSETINPSDQQTTDGGASQQVNSQPPVNRARRSHVDKRRIARNAVMLYIRMFIIMLVGLYTSRVVLRVLGVEDYGIYGVVAGVVTMLGFLSGSMAGATSRFLTFELGRGDPKRLNDTFCNALIVHLGISAVIFVFLETVGLWIVAKKLVIPEGRMHAAIWLYQFNVLVTILGITQTPYNALIIAHEKMDVYAYVEILNTVLRLAIVYMLQIGDYDKLIMYSVLSCGVAALILIIYRIYSLRHFPESRFHWVWDKKILKPMLVFSGWNLYGGVCWTTRQQAVNILINIFFGVAYNAASSLATTVQGVIKGFSSTSTTAFRPQIIKSYAIGDLKSMFNLMESAMSFTIFMTLLISLPVFVEIDYLMKLWLVTPPEMSIPFVRLLLVSGLFAMMNGVLGKGIEATGRNRKFNVYNGTIYLLSVPIMYVVFKLGFGVLWSYYILVATNVMIYLSMSFVLKYLIPQLPLRNFFWIIVKSAIICVVPLAVGYMIKDRFEEGLVRLIANTVLIVGIFLPLSYRFILDKPARDFVRKKVKSFLNPSGM